MKKINLDGKKMKDKKATHTYLQRKFNFPEYYGHNLDALWDLLCEIDEGTVINLKNVEDLKTNLKEYGEELIKVFTNWEREKDYFHLKISDKNE